MMREIGGWGMNSYLYAPKDDPYHRARWRDAYPDAELAQLSQLATAGREAGVELVYALHPGLDIVHSDEADQAAIGAKLRALHAAGVRRFALLFDDIPHGLTDPVDLARWGEGSTGSGRAHGATCTRTAADVLAPLGLGGTLIMVPTHYDGSGRSEYRDGLDETLAADIPVVWTGDDIVVGTVTEEHVRSASDAFGGRPLILWDNFPVNDFDRSRAFLGPLLGRAAGLPAAGLTGILANPMVEYEPSRFALRTVAEWAQDPEAYDPASAAERALHDVAGAEAEAVRPLVAAASSWPPSAPQHPALSAAVDAAFAGDPVEAERMIAELRALAGLPAATPLTTALHPWALAGQLTADVLTAALAHTRGDGGADAVETAWETARTARHGLARDVARAAAERALGHPLPDPPKPVDPSVG
jgi:hypothetical protein